MPGIREGKLLNMRMRPAEKYREAATRLASILHIACERFWEIGYRLWGIGCDFLVVGVSRRWDGFLAVGRLCP
jgi:hypothetical protein